MIVSIALLLRMLQCTVVFTVGNLASFQAPFPALCIRYYDYTVTFLINLLLYICINQCNL